MTVIMLLKVTFGVKLTPFTGAAGPRGVCIVHCARIAHDSAAAAAGIHTDAQTQSPQTAFLMTT